VEKANTGKTTKKVGYFSDPDVGLCGRDQQIARHHQSARRRNTNRKGCSCTGVKLSLMEERRKHESKPEDQQKFWLEACVFVWRNLKEKSSYGKGRRYLGQKIKGKMTYLSVCLCVCPRESDEQSSNRESGFRDWLGFLWTLSLPPLNPFILP
jgi:hypothetical protein